MRSYASRLSVLFALSPYLAKTSVFFLALHRAFVLFIIAVIARVRSEVAEVEFGAAIGCAVQGEVEAREELVVFQLLSERTRFLAGGISESF